MTVAHPADAVKELLAENLETATPTGRTEWIADALRTLLVAEVERLETKYPRRT